MEAKPVHTRMSIVMDKDNKKVSILVMRMIPKEKEDKYEQE